MKSSFCHLLRLSVIPFLLFAAGALRAQQADHPVFYTLNLNFALTIPQQAPPIYSGTGTVQIFDEASQLLGTSNIGGQALTSGPTTKIGIGTANFRILPNRNYTFTISATAGCKAKVSFAPTIASGYVTYINGSAATSYTFDNSGSASTNSITIPLRIGLPTNYGVDPQPVYLGAGTANSLVADKPIMYFGLGRMRNGNSAGVVGFRAQDFSATNFFTPAALYFSSYYPVPAGEVTQIKNGTVLRQILSREVLVDISAPTTTSYKLDFYPSSAVTGQPGGAGTVYTFGGSAFVSYTVSQNTSSGVSVTRTEDSTIWETNLVLSGTTWTFKDWHKQGTSLNSNLATAYSTTTAATVTATGPASGLSSTVPGYTDTALSWTKSFATYSWGLELAQTQGGASTTTPLTSNYSYYTSSVASGSAGASQGLLQWATRPDGTWTAYSYYVGDATTAATIPNGYVQCTFHPWLDTTATDTTGSVAAAATTANSAYDIHTYSYVAKGADTNGTGATSAVFLPASVISYAPGGSTVLKKSTWSYNTRATTLNARYVWSQTESNFSDLVPHSLTTTGLYYVPLASPSLLDDQPVSVTYSSGNKDSYAYFSGTWNTGTNTFSASAGGNDRLILCFHGLAGGGLSPTTVSSWTNNGITWAMDSVVMEGARSTVSETVIDTNGRPVFSGTNVFTAGGTLARIAGMANTYDTHCRLTTTVDIMRSISGNPYQSQYQYTAGLLQSAINPDGTSTSYLYDDLLRMYQKTSGVGGSEFYPAIVQNTLYDGANRPVSVMSGGTTPSILYYDTASRIIKRADPSPTAGTYLNTTYAYNSVNSVTVTSPTGAYTTNTSYADGRAKSVSGTATSPQYISYAANSTGMTVTGTNTSGTDQSQGWSTTQYDLLGRVVTQTVPTTGWTTTTNPNNRITTTSNYNFTTGLLSSQSSTYLATSSAVAPTHLYFYDAGRLTSDGMDLNGNGTLDATSNDRINVYDSFFSQDALGWLSVTTSSGYATSSGSLTPVATVFSRLTGFNSGTLGTFGLVVSDLSSTDANGQVSRQVESIKPSLLRHHIEVTLPGTTNTGFSETINGYSSQSQTPGGAFTAQEYDPLGRLVTSRSRGNGTTQSFAVANTNTYYGNTPYLNTQTVNGITTSYAYAWNPTSLVPNAYQMTTTDAAGNYRYTLSNAMGLPAHSGGTATSPVQYNYDSLGRMTTMTTWRTGNYAESNWPTTDGDTTTFTVEAATSLRTSKIFADANHIDFTYTPLGQLYQRKWARHVGDVTTPLVTATYAYYDGSTGTNTDVSYRTQELKSVTYNDGTTAVSYTYTRGGLPFEIADATGTRSFSYTNATLPFQVTSENLSAYYNSRVMTQQYDGAVRPAGFLLGSAAGSAADLSQAITYEPAGGLPQKLITTPANQAERTYTYSYVPYTQLPAGYTTPVSGGSYALSYGYQAATNLRNQVKTTFGTTTNIVTGFEPAYNNLGQIQSVRQSGTAFADYYNSSYSSVLNAYNYDAMGQLKSSALYRGNTDPSAPVGADELPGHHFEMRYDAMGNRTSAGESGNIPSAGGTDDSYTPNNLNQYSSKTNYVVRVLGTTAVPPASKSIYTAVAAAPSTNQVDRVWGADIVPAQSTSPASGLATVFAAIPGGGTSGQDLLLSDSSKSWFIPATPQAFQYDADGNLSNDGVWTYAYDAENRLTSMTTLLPANAGHKRWNLSFVYDHLGRRVQKTATNLDTTTDPTPSYTRRYVYNGWNLVAELDASGVTLKRSYTWGLDLAGSFSATGGVGALLQITDHAANRNYFTAYDQNGNVAALTRDNGDPATAYEYSPFGEPMRADVNPLDTTLRDNPFRFSTKFTDVESGLVYYGMRYYNPALGRFINRDPIEESGGVNLYGFCGNDGVNSYDMLGCDPRVTVVDAHHIKYQGRVSYTSADADVLARIMNTPMDLHGFGGNSSTYGLPTSGDDIRGDPTAAVYGDGDSGGWVDSKGNPVSAPVASAAATTSTYKDPNNTKSTFLGRLFNGTNNEPSGPSVKLTPMQVKGNGSMEPIDPNSTGGVWQTLWNAYSQNQMMQMRTQMAQTEAGVRVWNNRTNAFGTGGALALYGTGIGTVTEGYIGWSVGEQRDLSGWESALSIVDGELQGVSLYMGGRSLFSTRLSAFDLKLSQTVENHLGDITKAGTPARPYGDSRLLMQQIMDARRPVPDPGGVPGGLRWDVPGTMNGAQGTYQLVVEPKTNTVLHFLFTK